MTCKITIFFSYMQVRTRFFYFFVLFLTFFVLFMFLLVLLFYVSSVRCASLILSLFPPVFMWKN